VTVDAKRILAIVEASVRVPLQHYQNSAS